MRTAQLPRHHPHDLRTGPARPDVRHLEWPGWEVDVASFGCGSVASPGGRVPGAILAEDLPGEMGPAAPRIELSAQLTGQVDVSCCCAPSALLIGSGDPPLMLPRIPGEGRAASAAPDGAVLLAWTPSLLNALTVSQVAHAPQLLREETDVAGQLWSWLRQAAADRSPGAAVLVARHRRFTAGCGHPGA